MGEKTDFHEEIPETNQATSPIKEMPLVEQCHIRF
jgi:hypothetical protein